MTLGKRIKKYRQDAFLSQEQLADLSHIAVSTIRKYESDERNPKEEQLEKLAHALHTSTAALKGLSIESIEDALPALYVAGNWGDIQFIGKKDESGNYIKDSLYFRFNNEELMNFLVEWAKKKEELDSIKIASDLLKDLDSRIVLEARMEDLTDEIENKLVLNRINSEIYQEIDISSINFPVTFEREFPILTNYTQIIRNYFELAMKIKYDLVYTRVIDRLYFTFNSKDVCNMDILKIKDDTLLDFLYYFSECAKVGFRADIYSFMQGGKKLFRFVLYDDFLTCAGDFLRNVLELRWVKGVIPGNEKLLSDLYKKIENFDEDFTEPEFVF